MGELYTAQECRTLWFSEAGTRLVCEALSERFGRPVEPAEAEALAGHTDDVELARFIRDLGKQAFVLPVEPDEIARMIEMAKIDGLLLRKTLEAPSDFGSWLTGDPALPESIDWPIGEESGEPLTFTAQINLSELPPNENLPCTGVLFFFANLTTEPGDSHCESRVIYVEGPVDFTQTRRNNDLTDPAPAVPVSFEAVTGCNDVLFSSWPFAKAAREFSSKMCAEIVWLDILSPAPASFFSRLFPERPIKIQQHRHNLLLGPDWGSWNDIDYRVKGPTRIPLLTLVLDDPDLGWEQFMWSEYPVNFTVEPSDLKRRDFGRVAAVLRDQ